jgi:RNA polymerase sigma-70 factor (ECF subfamily)
MQPAVVRVTEVVQTGDTTLVDRARSGDTMAFESLIVPRLPGAFRLASAILGSEADAADATQNALLAAWRELPRLRGADHFDAWLHRILVNECRMQVRRRGRVREIPMGPEAGPDAQGAARTTATLDRIEVMDLLEDAFEQLDPEDRAMVAMHHLEDRPLAEIAASLHMPVGTVKWRLHEARQALQRALEAMG